jgi:hypothetical protein
MLRRPCELPGIHLGEGCSSIADAEFQQRCGPPGTTSLNAVRTAALLEFRTRCREPSAIQA